MFKNFVLPFALSLLFFCNNTAYGLEIQIGNQNADPGQAVTISVTVGDYDQEKIAAAALMLTYNTSMLTLNSIDSNFFTSFSDQWNSLSPTPDPLPPGSVEVDLQTYTHPLLFTTQAGTPMGKTMLVGARVKSGTPSVVFSLYFTISGSAPSGIYPISISPIIVDNTDAGYSTSGESIPIFVGALENQPDLTQAYPAYSPTIINGAILVNITVVDSDSDGIDDDWEIAHFGNLTTADQTSDFEGDGYTDLQEYLNYLAGETDPQLMPYNPKVKNAPGGTGYVSVKSNNSFWNIMLPAILNTVDKK